MDMLKIKRYKSLANHSTEKPHTLWEMLLAFQKCKNFYIRMPPNIITILDHIISYARGSDTYMPLRCQSLNIR